MFAVKYLNFRPLCFISVFSVLLKKSFETIFEN